MANRGVCFPFTFDYNAYCEEQVPGGEELFFSNLTHISEATRCVKYPTFIEEYWEEGQLTEGGVFTGKIFNYTLSFNMATIGRYIGCESVGAKYSPMWRYNLPAQDINRTLYGIDSIFEFHSNVVHNLVREAQVIQLLTVTIFCPRQNMLFEVTDRDAFVIYHTLK